MTFSLPLMLLFELVDAFELFDPLDALEAAEAFELTDDRLVFDDLKLELTDDFYDSHSYSSYSSDSSY